jgi:hypothetical protein
MTYKRLPPAQRNLNSKARAELDRWQTALPKPLRSKLQKLDDAATYGQHEIPLKPKHGHQADRRAELQELRKARLAAERAAYEERLKEAPRTFRSEARVKLSGR